MSTRLHLNFETLRTLRGADLDLVRGAGTGTCPATTVVKTNDCTQAWQPTGLLACTDTSLGGCTTVDRTVTRVFSGDIC